MSALIPNKIESKTIEMWTYLNYLPNELNTVNEKLVFQKLQALNNKHIRLCGLVQSVTKLNNIIGHDIDNLTGISRFKVSFESMFYPLPVEGKNYIVTVQTIGVNGIYLHLLPYTIFATYGSCDKQSIKDTSYIEIRITKIQYKEDIGENIIFGFIVRIINNV